MQGVLFGAWLPGPLKPPSAHPQDPSTVKGLTSHDWISSTPRDPPPSASSRCLPWSPPDQRGSTSVSPRGICHGHHQTSRADCHFSGIHILTTTLGVTSSPHVHLPCRHRQDPPTAWDSSPIGSVPPSFMESTATLSSWEPHPMIWHQPMYVSYAITHWIRPQHGIPIPLDPPTFLHSTSNAFALAQVRLLRCPPLDPPTAWDPYPIGSANLFGLHFLQIGVGTTYAVIHWIRPQHGTPIPLDPPTFLASSPHDLALAHVRLLRRHPPDPPTAWDSYPFGSANLFDIHIHPAVLGTTSHGLASAHVELSRHAAVIHWIRPQHGTPIPLDPPTFLHSTSTPLTHPPRSPTLSVRRRGARGERSSSTKPPDPDHQALKLGGWSSPDWGPRAPSARRGGASAVTSRCSVSTVLGGRCEVREGILFSSH